MDLDTLDVALAVGLVLGLLASALGIPPPIYGKWFLPYDPIGEPLRDG